MHSNENFNLNNSKLHNNTQVKGKINSTKHNVLEKNVWTSPYQLFKEITKILDTIILENCRNYEIIISELNQFIQQPSEENFKPLESILINLKEVDLKELIIKIFGLYPLLLNLSIKTALINSACKEQINLKNANISPQFRNPIKMQLGLYGKETEPGSEELIQSLSNFAEGLENFADLDILRNLLQDVWQSTFSTNSFDETSMQLFYANKIYWNFDQVIEEIRAKLPENDGNEVDLGDWLQCYTWLTTDRDGRPHDTNIKTKKLIEKLESSIRDNYIKELSSLYEAYPNCMRFESIIERLAMNDVDSYGSPEELLEDLHDLKKFFPVLENIILKIKTFGFHYLKLEFRENSKMSTEVIDTLLKPQIIEKIIHIKNKSYCELNPKEKNLLLTDLLQLSNEEISQIKTDYLVRNKKTYDEKTAIYNGVDYIELMDIDSDYIKQVNVASTLGRFDLMVTYPDRLHIHAIAETAGPEDALALLFLSKIATGRIDYLDVALQPEDSSGAVAIIEMISTLYQNPVYEKHLKSRNNNQYIVFGPSDTGKQGGKAMHIANMHIAQVHRIIASQFNINPIIHVIVGYEHARCNSAIEDTLDGYGTLHQNQSRYMMAGLNEMRSELLSPKQTVSFLSNLYFIHANYNAIPDNTIANIDTKARFWLKIVERYQRWFHDHPSLPGLLRLIARFDIINATAKGTRPPTRILNAKTLEDQPKMIRAIPWSRSFLLAGIHCEVIGSGHLASLPEYQLHQMYLQEKYFKQYVHHIAYGTARTDMDFAWKTAQLQRPSEVEIRCLAMEVECGYDILSARHILAWIDYEITQASCFVYKALHGKAPEGKINRMNLLEMINPALFREVSLRNKLFEFHKIFLLESRQNPELLKKSYIKDLFTGALTILNTSLGMMYPKHTNLLNWDDAI